MKFKAFCMLRRTRRTAAGMGGEGLKMEHVCLTFTFSCHICDMMNMPAHTHSLCRPHMHGDKHIRDADTATPCPVPPQSRMKSCNDIHVVV